MNFQIIIVNTALCGALDQFAHRVLVLEVSEHRRRAVTQANKELLEEFHSILVELHAERQNSVNLWVELTRTNHLRRQAEAELEHSTSKCARIEKELVEEKQINANLGAETNALYEQHESMRVTAVVSTARNKELEAHLAMLYGTPEERLERSEREKEETEYKVTLENELKSSATYQKVLEQSAPSHSLRVRGSATSQGVPYQARI